MIQHIEELRPKLNVEAFRDSSHRIVLKQRKIEIGKTRADQHIAPQISQQCDGTRGTETLGFDIVRRIAGIDQ